MTTDVRFTNRGHVPAVFAVSDLPAAAIAFAAASAGHLVGSLKGRKVEVTVDRRLASLWCSNSFRPLGWAPPSPWDPLAGDYQTSDGWIRLHTNSPAHKRAVLRVLDIDADRSAIAAAVASLKADELEEVIVGAGGWGLRCENENSSRMVNF